MKKKMDFATKAKLIYSGELIIFAIAFITIALLKAFNVIPFNETRARVFNWITLFGGLWVISDLIWALVDKKRQQRIAIIDKFIHAPAGVYLVTFNLYCLITQTKEAYIYQYGLAIVLGYLGLCYIFEAIYHFKHPIPGLIEEEKETQEPVNEDSSREEKEEINHE